MASRVLKMISEMCAPVYCYGCLLAVVTAALKQSGVDADNFLLQRSLLSCQILKERLRSWRERERERGLTAIF